MARARFLGSFTDALPAPSLPEVAFAGRSNVGKSSLLNVLTGIQGLARVAKIPGRTQSLNLFVIDERWIAVDLPGYGYAKVSKSIRGAWKGFIETYLGERDTLRLVVVLLDARLPAQDMDKQLIANLRGHVAMLPVATKVDAIPRHQRAQTLRTLAIGHGLEGVVGFSATEDIGRDDVLAAIEASITVK